MRYPASLQTCTMQWLGQTQSNFKLVYCVCFSSCLLSLSLSFPYRTVRLFPNFSVLFLFCLLLFWFRTPVCLYWLVVFTVCLFDFDLFYVFFNVFSLSFLILIITFRTPAHTHTHACVTVFMVLIFEIQLLYTFPIFPGESTHLWKKQSARAHISFHTLSYPPYPPSTAQSVRKTATFCYYYCCEPQQRDTNFSVFYNPELKHSWSPVDLLITFIRLKERAKKSLTYFICKGCQIRQTCTHPFLTTQAIIKHAFLHDTAVQTEQSNCLQRSSASCFYIFESKNIGCFRYLDVLQIQVHASFTASLSLHATTPH